MLFFVAISLKRQVYIDPNGGLQLVTWRADKRASFVAFYASVDIMRVISLANR